MGLLEIIGVLALSIVAAIFYRLGGTGGAWWKNTKVRDCGVPLVSICSLKLIGIECPLWVWITYFLLSFATMTTYWEHWGSEGVEWYEWLLTGLVYGVPTFIFVYFGIDWVGCLSRIGVLGLTTVAWSELISKDTWEEWGRGFLFNISILLLTI